MQGIGYKWIQMGYTQKIGAAYNVPEAQLCFTT